MKILQLNSWTGRMKGATERFLREHDFDVICLQEAVWTNDCRSLLEHFSTSVEQIKEASGLQYDHRVATYFIEAFGGRVEQGNVIISRYQITDSQVIHLCGEYKNISEVYDNNGLDYQAQKIVLENGVVIVNYHGYWQKNPIGNEQTIECMRKVADAIRYENRPTIMCGDLNVVHESPAMRELDFLQDLTEDNKVKQTLQNIKFVGDVACDHILINEHVRAKNFRVYDDLLSDHKAISAEVEII